MLKSWGPCAAAVVLGLFAQVEGATAQTVHARKVPAGSTVELVLNGSRVGSATADASGDASIPLGDQALGGKTEMDVTVFLDACDDIHRIVLVERGASTSPAEAGCTRRDIIGLFLVKRITNLVVDTGGANPTIWLRQGPVDFTVRAPVSRWSRTPGGLIFFGGAGLASYRDAFVLLCGNVSPCEGDDSRTSLVAGATVWLGPFLGVEGAFIKPPTVNANGTSSTFRFNSALTSQLVAINGKVGIPAGVVRIYGQGGTNYHRATLTTSETIGDATVTVNGVVLPVTGGTQAIELKTGGWGWQFGGGLEVWVRPSVGIFGELDRTSVKGKALEGSQGEMHDYLTGVFFGLRVKIRR